MSEEKFVVLSIDDKGSKDIAKVISNETSRKLLAKLASRHYSESELAKELKLPLSTVEYNLELLRTSGLVKLKGYKYSKKGRNINYYEPAKKLIIIAPEQKAKESIFNLFKDKLLLPITVAVAVGTGYLANISLTATGGYQREMMDYAASKSLASAEQAVVAGAPVAYTNIFNINILLFAISLVVLIGLLAFMYWKNKHQN